MLLTEAGKKSLNLFIQEMDEVNDETVKTFLNSLTVDKAEEYGFRIFSSDIKQGDKILYLIPGWFLDFLPIGLEVQSINGEKIIYNGENLDNDTRFGLLAYGIFI